MSIDATITVGETADWIFTCNKAGAARDLTDASAVVLTMEEEISETVKIDAEACSVTDATAGEVTYSPSAGDVDTEGDYVVQLKVTFSGGDVEYFPNSELDKYRLRLDPAL